MKENLTRRSINDTQRGQTNFERVKSLTDEDIAKAVADDPDAAPLDIDWLDATLFVPTTKKAVSLRVDSDLLAFFRAGGRGYQTRMNAVLRQYMIHKLDKKKSA